MPKSFQHIKLLLALFALSIAGIASANGMVAEENCANGPCSCSALVDKNSLVELCYKSNDIPGDTLKCVTQTRYEACMGAYGEYEANME